MTKAEFPNGRGQVFAYGFFLRVPAYALLDQKFGLAGLAPNIEWSFEANSSDAFLCFVES